MVVSLRVEEEDDEDEELGFSFTVIDRRDGRMVTWAGRRW